MRLNFKEPGKTASEEDIRATEAALRVRFPDDYKAFLLSTNGGWGLDPELWFHVSGTSTSVIRRLYSVGLSVEPVTHSLLLETALIAQILPKGLVVIGDDPFGNKICLGVTNACVNGVYFWDHEIGQDSSSSEPPILKIADSFSAFLESLEARVSNEDTITSLGKRGDEKQLLAFLAAGGTFVQKNDIGCTLVQEAAKHGNVEMLRACYARGVSMHNLIQRAAINNKREAIEFLLSIGVDVNERLDAPNRSRLHGKTALDLCRDQSLSLWLKSKGATGTQTKGS